MRRLPVLIMLLTLFAAACGGGGEDFTALTLALSDRADFYARLDQASRSIDLALGTIVDPTLVVRLNDAVGRGVRVRLVLDADTPGATAGLYPGIELVTGNLTGRMEANFALLDGETALLLSTSLLTNEPFALFSLRHPDLFDILETEFSQMALYRRFGSGSHDEAGKLVLNHQRRFRIAGHEVELHFFPQNRILPMLSSRLGQADAPPLALLENLESASIAAAYHDMIKGKVDGTLRLGAAAVATISNRFFLLAGNDGGILTRPLAFNLFVLDASRQSRRTIVATSLPLIADGALAAADGVCLLVSGPMAEELSLNLAAWSRAQALDTRFTNVRFVEPVAPGDLVVSEVCWMGAYKGTTSEASAEFIELRNMSTDRLLDASGFRVLITNINLSTRSYTLPTPSVIQPGGHLVISRMDGVWTSPYLKWTDMSIYNTGFTVTVTDRNGVPLDRAGVVDAIIGGVSTLPRRTMVRILEPLGAGDLPGSWANCTVQTNIVAAYLPNTYASPGAD